jgi:predicted ATPase
MITRTHTFLENTSAALNHEDITERAYKLWLAAGEPYGRDEEFWLEAEHYLWHLNNQKKDTPTIAALSAFSELMHGATPEKIKTEKVSKAKVQPKRPARKINKSLERSL